MPLKSSDRKRRNKREKWIENESNRGTRSYFSGKGISGGQKVIVVIRTSMIVEDF